MQGCAGRAGFRKRAECRRALWKRKDSFQSGCISQVPPHFVDPERAFGYFPFQGLCSSSADPGWIWPWNLTHLLQHIPCVSFIHLHRLKFKKILQSRRKNPAKILTIPPCTHNWECWNIFSWIKGNGKFAFFFLLFNCFENCYENSLSTHFFPSQMNKKLPKKSVGGTTLPHFLFQPCPGNLLSMGHRSILIFPGSWELRKFHALSPLSPQFQVLFPSRMLNSCTFIPSLPAEYSKCPQHSWFLLQPLSRTWTEPRQGQVWISWTFHQISFLAEHH